MDSALKWRFCQAGMIYRPVRERSVEQLLSLAEQSLAATGYEDLSLLSLSTGDYGCIVPLMQSLMARCESERIAVSFPSLRAGTLSPELMTLIKKVRKTGFTMAVEAGSQRLRDVINKNITQEDIFTMVEDAFRLGWQVIKLYFMVGLPGETQQDLDELVDLVKNILRIKGAKGRQGKINVSANTFIPKSHSPFQWARQISLGESKDKIEWLKGALKLSRVQFKWQNPENSLLEGLWARGDRRLAGLLLTAYDKGCRFDGWSDQFQYDKWIESIQEAGVDADFFITRKRDTEEALPWDHIDSRVKKTFLKREWEKASAGILNSDCRGNPCTNCGVCDHKTIRPELAREKQCNTPLSEPESPLTEDFYKTITVSYAKRDQARFFGHLEMVKIFLRAIRRAGIPVMYSHGFHPLPKVSFDDPIPLGFESLAETFRIRVPGNVRPEEVIAKLNEALPEGLHVQGCRIELTRPRGKSYRKETYEVTLPEEEFDPEPFESFRSAEQVMIYRRNRKGMDIEIDLKQVVCSMERLAPERLKMVLLISSGQTVRPNQVSICRNTPLNRPAS